MFGGEFLKGENKKSIEEREKEIKTREKKRRNKYLRIYELLCFLAEMSSIIKRTLTICFVLRF